MREITIAVIGDIHAERERLDRVLARLAPHEAELVLLVGDIGVDPPWNEPARSAQRAAHDESMHEMIGRVRERLGPHIVFVPGNHDLADPPPGLPAVNCDRRIVEAAGLRIAGLGGAGPGRFGFPYEWEEADVSRVLDELASGPGLLDVALFHAPPNDCRLDLTKRGDHVGSAAVRRFVARARPPLFVCGHIHEAWSVEQVEGGTCLNAGSLGPPHGQDIGWIVRASASGATSIRSIRADAEGTVTETDWI